MLNAIAQIIIELVGHSYLYFDSALEIKISPHTQPLTFWGACANEKGEVYVMDSDEQWHQVEEDAVSFLLIATLYQRLYFLKSRYIGAVKNEEVLS